VKFIAAHPRTCGFLLVTVMAELVIIAMQGSM